MFFRWGHSKRDVQSRCHTSACQTQISSTNLIIFPPYRAEDILVRGSPHGFIDQKRLVGLELPMYRTISMAQPPMLIPHPRT